MNTDYAAKRLAEMTMPRQTHHKAPASCIGLVSAVDAKTGRVKLTYQGIGTDVEGKSIGSDWAPVLLPMAGNGRAACFAPKSGDQALVLFVNGDWSQPIVAGFLASEADPLPQDMQAGKSGIVLSPGGPSVVLDETKAKDKPTIVISDGDGNSVVVKTDVNTIEITAAGDIKLSAVDGKVSIAAKTIDFTSSEGTTLNAATVDVKAPDGPVNLHGKQINLN
jgi:phage baseplate assembly protein gpV